MHISEYKCIIFLLSCVCTVGTVFIGDLERCGNPSKERLSVFLEKVRQEMPKAHLELLRSGSLCVTTEALGAVLCSACLAVHSLLF